MILGLLVREKFEFEIADCSVILALMKRVVFITCLGSGVGTCGGGGAFGTGDAPSILDLVFFDGGGFGSGDGTSSISISSSSLFDSLMRIESRRGRYSVRFVEGRSGSECVGESDFSGFASSSAGSRGGHGVSVINSGSGEFSVSCEDGSFI